MRRFVRFNATVLKGAGTILLGLAVVSLVLFVFSPLGDWICGPDECMEPDTEWIGGRPWALFGLVGIVLIVLIIFVQIVFVQMLFKVAPKRAMFLSLYVIVIIKMMNYATSSVMSIIGAEFVLFSGVLVFVYYVLLAGSSVVKKSPGLGPGRYRPSGGQFREPPDSRQR